MTAKNVQEPAQPTQPRQLPGQHPHPHARQDGGMSTQAPGPKFKSPDAAGYSGTAGHFNDAYRALAG